MSGCTVDYPIYGITALDSGRIALCGGGGSVKSGVPNVIEVYDTKGKGMALTHRYDCDSMAPTCLAAHPGDPVLAAGADHKLLLLEVEKPPKKITKANIPKLKLTLEREVVKVTEREVARGGGEIVKAVTFCCYGEQLVTVGEDNAITIWEYPSMVRRWRITTHLSEVTQVTAHPMGQPEMVTATRGSECVVWDIETGQNLKQIRFSGGTVGVKFRYRNIKYGAYGETFYAVILPVAWTRACASHVVKYTTERWEISKQTYIAGEPLAELAVSPNDTLLATASSNGHVYVYDSSSLALRRRIMDVHGLFITGLCFIPAYNTDTHFKLLSVSADRECKVHNPHLADPIRFAKALLFILLLLGLLYILYCVLDSHHLLPVIDDFQTAETPHQHSHHSEL